MADTNEGGLKQLLPEQAHAEPGLRATEHFMEQMEEGQGPSGERNWDEQRWQEEQQAQDEQQQESLRQKAGNQNEETFVVRGQNVGKENVDRFEQLMPKVAEADSMLEGTEELIEDQQEHAREGEKESGSSGETRQKQQATEEPQATEETELQEFLRQMEMPSDSGGPVSKEGKYDIHGDIQCSEGKAQFWGPEEKPSEKRKELAVSGTATEILHVALRDAKFAFQCAEKTLTDLQYLTNQYVKSAGTTPTALGLEDDLLLPPYKTLGSPRSLGASGPGLFGLLTNLVKLPGKAAVAAACAAAAVAEYTYEVSLEFTGAAVSAAGKVLGVAESGAAAAGRAAKGGAQQAAYAAKSTMNGY